MLANIGAAVPLLLLIFRAALNDLGFNPIDTVTDRTGEAGLMLLFLSLAITPLNIATGLRPILKLRRSLGLWSFGYVVLHLSTYIGWDYALDWRLIFEDSLLQKRYVFVGFTALLLLLPLAVTSFRWWQKKLGKSWKKLHRLAYVAAGLAVLHFLWLVKVDRTEPLIYATLLSVMLLMRVPPVRKRIVSWRRSLSKRISQKESRKPSFAG